MGVSKILLNGVAQMDITDTTATAADVAQGKVFYGADGNRTTGTASGSSAVIQPLSVSANGTYTAPSGVDGYSPVTVNVSGGVVEEKNVNFYDYDGTLLHSFSTAEVNDSGFTMPGNPTHTGLTAQGWNWTLADIRTQLAAMPTQPVNIGQMYVTDDGKTRIYIELDDIRKNPYLGLYVNGTVSVDWGDGSAATTVTGTSLATVSSSLHEYANGGDYVITITVISGSFAISGAGASTHLISKGGSSSANQNRIYQRMIKKVELGRNVNLSNYAFSACSLLESITIPSGVAVSGDYAFYNCYNLSFVTVPDGITDLGNFAFVSAYNMKALSLPCSLTAISQSGIASCVTLRNVTIPYRVTSIGSSAFSYCYSLRFNDITLPSGLTSIGDSAFSYCENINSVSIPSTITSIGNSAFRYCNALSSVVISGGEPTIGMYAFANCYLLQSISIPDGVTSIGTYAFNTDHMLQNITLPSGLTSISQYMLGSCYSLLSITIPSGVTTIASYAFYYCFGLKEIHFKPTTPPTVSSGAWQSVPTDCVIYVPTGTLSAYKSASNYPSSYAYTYVEE